MQEGKRALARPDKLYPGATAETMQPADSYEAETQQRTEAQLKSALESLLFVAGRPLERAELRRLLTINDSQLEAALDALAAECGTRGVRVQRLGEQVQLVS